MNSLRLIAITIAVFFSSFSYAGDDEYKLKQGDAVFISVFGEEPTLQKEVRVLPDGSITFPLAGRLSVVNLTSSEVEKQVAEKLKEFLPEPQVTVIVSSIEGNKIFVVGKVLKPGAILLTGPTSALQALSATGGFDRFAHLNDIKVLREVGGGTQVISIKYESLLNGEDLSSNIQLLAGDTIVVP
ncbi:MAG: polysaccharide biosynthesis/export family protein [Methylotenera sp.]|nr:polysaccharide biosynthesis/export family protein [Methylotenera sp.]